MLRGRRWIGALLVGALALLGCRGAAPAGEPVVLVTPAPATEAPTPTATPTATPAPVTLPPLTGDALAKARNKLEELGLECRTIGEGLLVTEQTPPPGTAVPKGGTVVLTLGGEEENIGDADRAAFLSVKDMVEEKMEVRP